MAGIFSQEEVSRKAIEAFLKRYPHLSSSIGLYAGPFASIERLDSPDAYLLVPIRDASGLRGIIQLNGKGLAIDSCAEIRDPESTFLIPEKTVLNLVKTSLPNRHGWGKPFLAWKPCRESYDSMRPLWVVPQTEGQVYVTQNCDVFEELTTGKGG
jgi:hypothetical protein